jgi:hypothetical protein
MVGTPLPFTVVNMVSTSGGLDSYSSSEQTVIVGEAVGCPDATVGVMLGELVGAVVGSEVPRQLVVLVVSTTNPSKHKQENPKAS